MSEATHRRRWFRFVAGPMTVGFVAVTWLIWEWVFILRREGVIRHINATGKGRIALVSEWEKAGSDWVQWPDPSLKPTIPVWRRWLGDEPVAVVFQATGNEKDLANMRYLFPEADRIDIGPRLSYTRRPVD
jgi:hypothetical protein